MGLETKLTKVQSTIHINCLMRICRTNFIAGIGLASRYMCYPIELSTSLQRIFGTPRTPLPDAKSPQRYRRQCSLLEGYMEMLCARKYDTRETRFRQLTNLNTCAYWAQIKRSMFTCANSDPVAWACYRTRAS